MIYKTKTIENNIKQIKMNMFVKDMESVYINLKIHGNDKKINVRYCEKLRHSLH